MEIGRFSKSYGLWCIPFGPYGLPIDSSDFLWSFPVLLTRMPSVRCMKRLPATEILSDPPSNPVKSTSEARSWVGQIHEILNFSKSYGLWRIPFGPYGLPIDSSSFL